MLPAAADNRPPLTCERCLRTQLSSPIAKPARINARAVATLSSSVTPSTGAASNADAAGQQHDQMSAGVCRLARQFQRAPSCRNTGCVWRWMARGKCFKPREQRGTLRRRGGDQTGANSDARVRKCARHRPRGLPAATTTGSTTSAANVAPGLTPSASDRRVETGRWRVYRRTKDAAGVIADFGKRGGRAAASGQTSQRGR